MLTPYTRNKDFSDDQANNVGGRSTVDTTGLDSELDEIKTVLDEARTYFALLLRDDLSQIVSADALVYISASLNSGSVFVWRSQWLTATDYLVNNMVFEGGASYICVIAHTSGTFATDLAAGKWELLAQQGSATALPAQGGNANKVLTTDGSNPSWASPQTLANSNTPAGNIVATTIQAAINELDTEKAAIVDSVMDGDAAGGDLTGTYPNPTIANSVITRAKTATAHALVKRTINQTLSDGTQTKIQFDSEIHDTANIHDNVTNNTRLTVPSGYNWARLTGQVEFLANPTGIRTLQIQKNNANGDVTYPGGWGLVYAPAISGGAGTFMQVSSPILPVVAGDYFELAASQNSGGNLDLRGVGCWFGIELWK